ncbi:glucose 1-dehydrogenase [Talaromyces proteolyticus]|uniref:Glucose 1-dehydrogenase n=1 Tax=Talaromyces proteolyticus TaxID=1131652 RepID=A0AAD4KN22_9EURO|nr:glucose 1-dehydrogenase [Talaromyces proteolyticus]KAH8695625.1 glucose 1-dehydrogenase [Talaromyces proteolyticus]
MPTAFITGGASGLGKATAEMLAKKGFKVFIADQNKINAANVTAQLNTQGHVASFAETDVSDWSSQAKAFTQAVRTFKRIDYVYAIAGINEKRWLTNDISGEFQPPDLTVLDVDAKGLFYTVALAVQQFRRQELNSDGFRGKISVVGSVCGLYSCPTIPVYTAAKHAITGFVRSYGTYLPEEYITMNAVCPSVVRTNMSTSAFYDSLESQGVMTPMHGVLETFEKWLGVDKTSGICYEVGPNYDKLGALETAQPPFPDDESALVFEKLYHRGRPLQGPL